MSTVGNEVALNYTHTWAIAGQGTTQGVGCGSPGSLIHPRSPLGPLVEVLRERGTGWVSSPLLWLSPRKGPGSGERGHHPLGGERALSLLLAPLGKSHHLGLVLTLPPI